MSVLFSVIAGEYGRCLVASSMMVFVAIILAFSKETPKII